MLNITMADRVKKNKPPREVGVSVERSTERSTYYPDSHFHPYNPAYLYNRRMDYSLYDEALLDDVVNSLMEYKISLILGNGFFIETDDEKIREFWEVVLHEEYEGSFKQALRKILSALSYGFSLTEKILKPITFKGKQYWGIKSLKTRPPHGIKIDTDEYGNIVKIIQQSAGENAQDLDLDPKTFILFTYRPKFENPYGQADITSGVYRNVFSKRSIIKFLNIALERFAMPLAVGKHPSDATEKEIDALFDVVGNLTAKASATISKDFEIELLEASKDPAASYLSAIRYYNLSIARALLISDLQGMSGDQMSGGGLGGGLGDVQFSIMMDIFNAIGDEVVALINHHLIRPLTRLNFGEKLTAELKLNGLTRVERQKAAELFMVYMEKGGRPNDEQTNWLMDQIGAPIGEQMEDQDDELGTTQVNNPVHRGDGLLPEDTPDNQGLYPQTSTSPSPPPTPGQQAKQPPAPVTPNQPAPKKPKFSEHRFVDAWKEGTPDNRGLYPSEKRVDFEGIDNKTKSMVDDYVGKLDNAVKDMLAEYYEVLQRRRIIDGKKFVLLWQLNAKYPHTKAVKSVFKEMMRDGYTNGMQTAKNESEKQSSFAAIPAEAAIALEEIVNQWTESRIISLTKNVSDDVIQTATVIIEDAIRTGKGTRETIKLLDDTLEVKLGKAQLERIVRTNVMSAFNQGRLQTIKKAPGVIGMQWSAILDGLTSPICRRLDGKIFKPDETNEYPMPAHPNCRSVWVAVFDEDVEGKDAKEIFEPKPNIELRGGFMQLVKEPQ